MSEKSLSQQSPSPSKVGFAMPRRSMLKGAAGVAGIAAFPAVLAACGSDDAETGTETETESGSGGGIELGTASGDLTIGSNYSNALPQAGLAAAVAAIPNGDQSVVHAVIVVVRDAGLDRPRDIPVEVVTQYVVIDVPATNAATAAPEKP